MSSSHGSHSGNKKFLKIIGIALRIGFDIVCTAILFTILWKAGMNGELEVQGRTYHSGNAFQTGYDWTVHAMAAGFVNILVPLCHMKFSAAGMAVLDNLVSWETFTFAVDTVLGLVTTFIAYTLWRNWWLGGTVLLLGLASLAWFVIMWALQLFGPLLPPLVLAVGIVGAIVMGGWKALQWLWKLVEDAEGH